MDLDEAFDSQLLEGVTNGGEAYFELLTEFVGHEALAREKVAGEDCGAEGLVDFVGGAFFSERR